MWQTEKKSEILVLGNAIHTGLKQWNVCGDVYINKNKDKLTAELKTK